MNYNPIAFAGNLSRAYEISKCGNHPIKVITTPNADDLTLSARDLKLLTDFFDIQCSDDYDMIIEVCRPDGNSMLQALAIGRYETKADIENRISVFQKSAFSEFNDSITGASQSLLKTAIDRLGLEFTAILKILNVAKTIAQMSACNSYKPEHIAEAIQYMSVKEDAQ